MKTTPPNARLASLANLLATWPDREDLRQSCLEWEAYWRGKSSEKPAPVKTGVAFRDSDYHVFCEAFACVRFGWASKAHLHTERTERRMRQTPVLTRYPLAARVGTPQVRDGKE